MPVCGGICSLFKFVTFFTSSCHSLLLVLCCSCLHLVQFKTGKNRVVCELLVGLNLGNSLG